MKLEQHGREIVADMGTPDGRIVAVATEPEGALLSATCPDHVFSQAMKDIAFIVKAVNNHGALVGLIKAITDALQRRGTLGALTPNEFALMNAARAVLEAVENAE